MLLRLFFTLVDFYIKEVRVHLELAVPVWHSGLTLTLSADIERVQRVAVSIMVDNAHYEQACAMLGIKPLYIRRQELCERFAIKTAADESRHNDLFQLEKNGTHNTRSEQTRFREHICNKILQESPALPYKNTEQYITLLPYL